MSNHGGSYMLNAVIRLLYEEGLMKDLTHEKQIEIIERIIKIGYREDCNSGEILEDLDDYIDIELDDI